MFQERGTTMYTYKIHSRSQNSNFFIYMLVDRTDYVLTKKLDIKKTQQNIKIVAFRE